MSYEPENLGQQLPSKPLLDELTAVAKSLGSGEAVLPAEIQNLLGRAALTITHLGELAYSDHLTGLASSRYFEDFVVPKLTMFCSGERRTGGPDTFMVGIADINGLKQVNETKGYDAGDGLIRAAALRIKQLLRTEDIVTRHGDRADEFIIIMPIEGIGDVFPEIAEIIGHRINSDGLSMALGFVSLDDFENVDAALAAAQEAMMQNKAALKSNDEPV